VGRTKREFRRLEQLDVSESSPGFHLIAGEPTPAANPFRALA